MKREQTCNEMLCALVPLAIVNGGERIKQSCQLELQERGLAIKWNWLVGLLREYNAILLMPYCRVLGLKHTETQTLVNGLHDQDSINSLLKVRKEKTIRTRIASYEGFECNYSSILNGICQRIHTHIHIHTQYEIMTQTHNELDWQLKPTLIFVSSHFFALFTWMKQKWSPQSHFIHGKWKKVANFNQQ